MACLREQNSRPTSSLDNAATALKTYTTLKPKSADALNRPSPGSTRSGVQDWETLYSRPQQRTQALSPSLILAPNSTSKLGKALATVTNPARERRRELELDGDEQRVQPGRELPDRAARRLQA